MENAGAAHFGQRKTVHRVHAQMTAAGSCPTVKTPDRIWFANTDMQSFYEFPRALGDTSAFAHWLGAGRLFVTPNANEPRKYHNALMAMMPGDAVFAYEDQVGFVGIGRVRSPKDLLDGCGGTALYPTPTEIVRSLAVDWNTSVTRTVSQVSAFATVNGIGLRACNKGKPLHTHLLEMLQEVHARRDADPDAQEEIALHRIQTDTTRDSTTKAQLIQARVGQGRFRKAVLAREQACRLTGITQPACLVASHIKPWADCDDHERLDDANGLMLAPHVDHLFDTGQISFQDNGQLIVSPALDRAVLQAWHLDEASNAGEFAPDQRRYLAHHRLHVLGQARMCRVRNLVGDANGGAIALDQSPFADITEGAT